MRKVPKSPEVRARIERGTGMLFEDLFPPELVALEKHPLPKEIAVIREMTVPQLREALSREIVLPSPEEAMIAQEPYALALEAISKHLSPKEGRILRLRFGIDGEEDHTLEETAMIFGVSRERIRGIEAQAIRKLRWRLTHPGEGLDTQAAVR